MSTDKDVSSNDTPNDDTIHIEHLGVILKMMLEHLGYLPKQSKYLSGGLLPFLLTWMGS